MLRERVHWNRLLLFKVEHMEDIRDILKNWGMEDREVRKEENSGAAIAAGVWNILGENWSLKTGGNFAGLRHHIGISRILADNGVTASCPLPTLDGQDFLTCGDHYFVITEKVADNFLSTKITQPEKQDFYLDMYAREVAAIDRALAGGSEDFRKVLRWAVERTRETAASLEADGTASPRTPEQGTEAEYFVCATPVALTVTALLERLQVKNVFALLAMLTLFVAWSGGAPAYARMLRGNLALARDIRRVSGSCCCNTDKN